MVVINFGVSFVVKSQVVINFGVSFVVKSQEVIHLGCHFRKITLYGIDFDQISLTWSKFWIIFTILGYIFSVACKFWGIVFAKIYKF